mgnify:FL=1|tara:strand:- start:754 stop:1332 length:579 start_codon:yes stop_codon:yes gene_type:complete
MTDVYTMNLSENSDGMVNLNNNKSTNFIANNETNPLPPPTFSPQQQQQQMPNIPLEKNLSENKQIMDSTSISDIMGQPEAPLEPPMMAQDPRMTQMQMQAPMMQAQAQPQAQPQAQSNKSNGNANPFNLTDEQFQALVVAVCTAIAISKPVQEKLANFVPSFLNDQGNRSMVGLASTGVAAAAVFYIIKKYT